MKLNNNPRKNTFNDFSLFIYPWSGKQGWKKEQIEKDCKESFFKYLWEKFQLSPKECGEVWKLHQISIKRAKIREIMECPFDGKASIWKEENALWLKYAKEHSEIDPE